MQMEYCSGCLLWLYGPLGTTSCAADESNSRVQHYAHPEGAFTQAGLAQSLRSGSCVQEDPNLNSSITNHLIVGPFLVIYEAD